MGMGTGTNFGIRMFGRRSLGVFVLILLLTAAADLLAGCGRVSSAASNAPVSSTATIAAAQTTTTSEAPATTTTAATTTTSESPTTTTEAPETTTTLPPDPTGWTRFTAGDVSVALPSTFKGGAVGGSAYGAAVRRLAGWKTWQAGVQAHFQSYALVMGMFGKSDGHWVPIVIAMKRSLPAGASLAEFTEKEFGTPPAGVTLTPGEKTPTRETYTLVLPGRPAKGTTETDLFAFVLSGDTLYMVVYSGSSLKQWASLKTAYEQSADLIRVTAPAAAGDPGAGSATSGTSGTP
jgi:hypothetical protein